MKYVFDSQTGLYLSVHGESLASCEWVEGQENATQYENGDDIAAALNTETSSSDRFTGTLPGGNPPTKPHG